ncbi:MAG TPA: phosphoglucosamine mutase [Bacteroidales bacterium]|nr:phosphoglucosamine mutase [Bacteroidales bacterium]HSA42606.1 phosphoglucosamine mutase [Bacteroidales bacterium]
MALITSISGIRGTIGGIPGKGLTPPDILRFVSAYAGLLKSRYPREERRVVLGRDARISGEMVNKLVTATLQASGFDVVDLGLATTPTVELAVVHHHACAGIIITASHNPAHWNALKFLDDQGTFISAALGADILAHAAASDFTYEESGRLGNCTFDHDGLQRHIDAILAHPYVNQPAVAEASFTLVVDAVNSVGGIAVPELLKALGVKKTILINGTPDGRFAHDPEPLPEHLEVLCDAVVEQKAHCGFAVDPDVDRLAVVCENGEVFGEEYTLVAVADYVLGLHQGPAVSNLSSTRALRDICDKHQQPYFASAVGEVNVVEKMKECAAVIGGEGNGGVILPGLHYGRDALAGMALFLSHLATQKKSCSDLRDSYPRYTISKNKITLGSEMNTDMILSEIAGRYRNQPLLTIDGVKIEFGKDWVHLRKSNTEPVIRIYSESDSAVKADNLAKKLIEDIREIVKKG